MATITLLKLQSDNCIADWINFGINFGPTHVFWLSLYVSKEFSLNILQILCIRHICTSQGSRSHYSTCVLVCHSDKRLFLVSDLKKVIELEPANKPARDTVRRLEPIAAERREKLKEEMLGKYSFLKIMAVIKVSLANRQRISFRVHLQNQFTWCSSWGVLLLMTTILLFDVL